MKTHSSQAMTTCSMLRRAGAAFLFAALIATAMLELRAADPNPPAKMTYQGFLVDGNGNPLANAKVENYDVIFRIYDASQRGLLLWAEQQTVTVDRGNFSILLGDGSGVGSEPRPSLDAVFGGATASDRYISLTVKGLPGGDAEILPRLRLLPAPYAFLARNATSLIGPNGQPIITTASGTIQSAGGAPRGLGAVDLQNTRVENAQVASGNYSVVGGGQNNRATAQGAAVSGGTSNAANGFNGVVSGGSENRAQGVHATVAGGFQNLANSVDAAIGGGSRNQVSADRGTIAGGLDNRASGVQAAVGGGHQNKAEGLNSSVSGGFNNLASGTASSVGGGGNNQATALEALVGSGQNNKATKDRAVVVGGQDNLSAGINSFIGGGFQNQALAGGSTVAGGWENKSQGGNAGVLSGNRNVASAVDSMVGSGFENKATGDRSGVVAGHANTASGSNSLVAGGFRNTASGLEAAIAGGNDNVASASQANVAGGLQNHATKDHAAVGGGHSNRAAGVNSVVPGGFSNTAQGDHSLAAGRRAKANHHATFVWADDQDSDFASTGNQQFLIRAAGGVGIGTTTPTKALVQIEGSKANNLGRFGYLSPTGTIGTIPAGGEAAYSLYASGRIASFEFNTFSDERTKRILGRSDADQDLETLARLEITNFRLRDTITHGEGEQKKVIAQQVRQVFPQAVSMMTDAVPDIYRKAKADGSWIHLATDLKSGEKVRLITSAASEVLEVRQVENDRFQVAKDLQSGEVFVYGREVNDFLTVDYDALSMLNVSATQKLYRLVQEQRELIDRQEGQLTALTAAKNAQLSELKNEIETLKKLVGTLLHQNEVAAAE